MIEPNIQSNNKLWLRKLSMANLALLPILAWYAIPFPVGLGYALAMFLSAFVIVWQQFKIRVIPKEFWLVFIYVCFMWMAHNHFTLWTLIPPGGWTFFIFVITVIGGIITFDFYLLRKYMSYVVWVSIVLFWIQYILLITTGSQQFCFVPNLTGAFTYEGFTYGDLVARQMGNSPCSIFLEKSYMAYYLITYLALIWFSQNRFNRLLTKEIAIIIITILFLRSGSGLVGLAILSVAKVLDKFWTANISRRVLLIVLIVPLLAGTSFIYVRSELGQTIVSRIDEFTTEDTSGFSRVVGGYLMFDQLSSEEKLIGIIDAQERFGVQRADGRIRFYINGIQTILISLGYLGLCLYLLFYIALFRKVGISSKMCLIVLLIMSLLESNYLNPYMMLLTIIPCSELYLKVKNNIIP